MKVKFVDVGRDKKSWEAETPTVTFKWLKDQVRYVGKLKSSDIDFTDERDVDDLPIDGAFGSIVDGAFGSIVVAGYRPVGRYSIGKAVL